MQPAAGRGRGRGPGSPPVTRSQSDAAGRGSDNPRPATSGGKRQQKKKGPKSPKPDTPKEDPNQDISTPPPAEGPEKDTGSVEGGPGTVASTNASSVNSPMVAHMDPNVVLRLSGILRCTSLIRTYASVPRSNDHKTLGVRPRSPGSPFRSHD